jgi:hypothetical protein
VLHRARERFMTEFARLDGDRPGGDECVKVGYVVDNFSRGSLRRDRLVVIERHLASCPHCRSSAGTRWPEEVSRRGAASALDAEGYAAPHPGHGELRTGTG